MMKKKIWFCFLSLAFVFFWSIQQDQSAHAQEKDKDKLGRPIVTDFKVKGALDQIHYVDTSRLRARLEKVDIANDQTKQEARDLNGEGPSNQWINLGQGNMVEFLNIEDFGLEPYELSPYSLIVYPDVKRETGIFYYFPQRFYVGRDDNQKYQIGFDYKPESTTGNDVLITARLTPGYRYGSLKILNQLVKAFLRKEGKYNVEPTLLPLPATFTPKFQLSPYGIPDKNISLPGIERVTGELAVNIETTLENREFFIDQMSDQGIVGDVVLHPQPISDSAETLSTDIEIPVRASLLFCDKLAYSRAEWNRAGGSEYTVFKNTEVFPVRLKHLIYLRSHAQGIEVRGYDLGNQLMQPGDTAKIPNSSITSEIDAKSTLSAWIRYSIECDPDILEAVVSSLTGGVAAIPVETVELNVLNATKVFDSEGLGVEKLVVAVKSAYFDPKGKKSVQHTFTLTKDETKITLPKFYLWDHTDGASNRLLYEYLIGVVMKDGTRLRDQDWRKPDELFYTSIDIGESQITEIIGEVEEDVP